MVKQTTFASLETESETCEVSWDCKRLEVTDYLNTKQNKMEDSNMGETLKPYLSAVRVPKTGDKVFKDECLLSFDTPVNMLRLLQAGNLVLNNVGVNLRILLLCGCLNFLI